MPDLLDPPATVTRQPGAVPSPRRVAVVIEDEAIILLGLVTMLRDWGWTVLPAADLAGAEAALARSPVVPDVVVADQNLRRGLGLDAIARLRSLCGRAVPALLLTGQSDQHLADAARTAGCRLVLKPVTARQLHGALAGITGGPAADVAD